MAVAVHSTALGPALGGCRVRSYPDWSRAVEDALLLSEAMTWKAALAGLRRGGGKTVVALPAGAPAPRGGEREALLLDVAEAVADLGGRYWTGPDVGTGPADMDVIGRGTEHVFCRTTAAGGSGDSGPATADGTYAALQAVAEHLFGSPDVAGLRVGVLGLGSVGGRLARRLAAAGADLLVSDADLDRRQLADEVGARWAAPELLPAADLDLLVPAAVGGLLTPDLVPRLRCAGVVGPANNQLAEEGVAALLHETGIVWAPDYVVSAGGIIRAVALEQDGLSESATAARVDGIGATLGDVLREAAALGVPPHQAALARARTLVAGAATGAQPARGPQVSGRRGGTSPGRALSPG